MPSAPRILTFAERHGWKFFVGLGLLYVLFGVSDLSIAVTIDSRKLALALLAIGLLGTAISLTGQGPAGVGHGPSRTVLVR
jgi:hypothetical protein